MNGEMSFPQPQFQAEPAYGISDIACNVLCYNHRSLRKYLTHAFCESKDILNVEIKAPFLTEYL